MRLLWCTGLAALLLAVGLAFWLAPLQPGVLALQLAFTPRTFGAIVHVWPPEHLLRYRQHLPVDAVLLACYGVFGHRLAMRSELFRTYPPWARRMAALMLPLAAAFDAAENALHGWLTAAPRFNVAPLYAVSATCSTLKWLLLLTFAATALHALARSPE